MCVVYTQEPELESPVSTYNPKGRLWLGMPITSALEGRGRPIGSQGSLLSQLCIHGKCLVRDPFSRQEREQ